MKCKDRGNQRVCTAGGRQFVLRDRKRTSYKTAQLKEYRIHKSDTKGCGKHKSPSARIRCYNRNRDARLAK